MVDALQVNNDRLWMKKVITILERDLIGIARQNPASYSNVFLPNANYINAQLNAVHREFSSGSDDEYYRYIRTMLRKFIDIITGISTTIKSANEIMTRLRRLSEFIDEINSTTRVDQAKAFFNENIQFLTNRTLA